MLLLLWVIGALWLALTSHVGVGNSGVPPRYIANWCPWTYKMPPRIKNASNTRASHKRVRSTRDEGSLRQPSFDTIHFSNVENE